MQGVDVLGRVHIVDDDASFLAAMERRLRLAGYEVSTYASAQHFLDRLSSEDVPSCILLDVRLPELPGPELQSRLSGLGSRCLSYSSLAIPTLQPPCRPSRRGRMIF